MSSLKEKISNTPKEAIVLTAGVLILGASAYVFLLIAGRQLGDIEYAPLGAMWLLAFLICPGLFFPVDQELGRAIAARRARGEGVGPLVKAATKIVAIGVLVSVLLTFALGSLLLDRFFNDQWLLLIGFALCLATFAGEYLARGTFAGNQRLVEYGWVISAEGILRVVLALVLVVIGVQAAGPYGLVVGLAPLASIGLAFFLGRGKDLVDPGPPAHLRELTTALGTLVVASILCQTLVNVGPLLVKYNASAAQQELSGAFTKAVILTRIPLFLFQVVQAAMLPRLTHYAVRGERHNFRSTLHSILLVVGIIGLAGTVGAIFLGNFALGIFGSEFELPHLDWALLAAGNAFFLLCMASAQALIAVSGQKQTVIGWLTGLIAFAVVCIISSDVVRGVEFGVLLGGAVSFITMMILLTVRLNSSKIDLPADAVLADGQVFEAER